MPTRISAATRCAMRRQDPCAMAFGVQTHHLPWIQSGDEAIGKHRRIARRLYGDLQAAGSTLPFHNHNFEFVPTASGRLPMDILLEAGADDEMGSRCRLDDSRASGAVRLVRSLWKADHCDHVKDIALDGEAAGEDGWPMSATAPSTGRRCSRKSARNCREIFRDGARQPIRRRPVCQPLHRNRQKVE